MMEYLIIQCTDKSNNNIFTTKALPLIMCLCVYHKNVLSVKHCWTNVKVWKKWINIQYK